MPRTPGASCWRNSWASTGTASIVDHGLGLQSLYAHLSSIGVKVGDTVTQGQELGRSGTTGLAGGDHLHFTMLLGGHPVTPIDWWSQQWVQDRVLRKLREASAPAAAPAAPAAAAPATPASRSRRPGASPTDRIESAHVRRGRPRDIPRDGHRRPLAHLRLRRPHQATAEPAGRRHDGRRLLPGRRAGREPAVAGQRHARHGARRRRIGGVQPGDGAARRRADGSDAPPARRRGAAGAARVAGCSRRRCRSPACCGWR